MKNKFTNEQIEKAKECKSVEEIIALAKENGTDLTEAEATNIFAQFNPANGELSDSELETVAGGCEEKNYQCKNCCDGNSCPKGYIDLGSPSIGVRKLKCPDCGRLIREENDAPHASTIDFGDRRYKPW